MNLSIKKITIIPFVLLLMMSYSFVFANSLLNLYVTAPTKTTYLVGEELDLIGLAVKGDYVDENDVESFNVEITEYNITGFDSSTPGTKTITIEVGGKTATFDVVVEEVPVITPPTTEPTTTITTTRRRSSGGGGERRTIPVLPAQASPVASIVTAQGGQVLGASTYAFGADLRMGMQSDAVKELQERLRTEGFFTHPTSTGYFGPITHAAVKAYQKAKGIPFVTGFVGPLTRAELNK